MHYRLSLDTFYFGLCLDEFECVSFVEKIKKSLFFLRDLQPSDKFCRNRFYKFEMVREEFGFYMFFSPKLGCKNDYITIQLGGKFFKDIKLSQKFIDWLFQDYFGLIEYQRVDVALDVIYNSDDVLNFDVCKNTNTVGFPFPSYSKDWKNRTIPFMTYGRICKESSFINMVSSGKNDFVLRVYDKSLDLMEKYGKTYKDYYSLKNESSLVYRIEVQIRSDKLKVFVDNCNNNENSTGDSYFKFCYNFLYYVLYKYDFEFIDKRYLLGDDFFISNMNIKTIPTIEGRLAYDTKMMNSYYKKVIDDYNELRLKEEDENKLVNLKKAFIRDKELKIKKDSVSPFNNSYQDLLNMDLENVSKSMNIPF